MPLRPPPQLTSLFHAEAMDLASLRMHHGKPPCWLSDHDPEERECEGKLEAFHFIGRQRVRNGLGLWQGAEVWVPCSTCNHREYCPNCGGAGGFYDSLDQATVDELTPLAEWDPRNAGPGCEMHHRRLDLHRTPALHVPYAALPERVIEFATHWGLESDLERKYPRGGS